MAEFKIRLFYKPEVSINTAKGRIDIKKGNENYAHRLVGENLLKCSKIIVEVI